MAHAYPYSFQFTNWEGEEQTVCVLVHFERTRSKSYVFRSQSNWDDEKQTQITIKDDAAQADPEQNLFWPSMRKAAVMGLLEHGCLEDSLPDNSYEITKKIRDLPGDPALCEMLAMLPPELKVKSVDNGWC